MDNSVRIAMINGVLYAVHGEMAAVLRSPMTDPEDVQKRLRDMRDNAVALLGWIDVVAPPSGE